MRILLWLGVFFVTLAAKAETVDVTLRAQFVFGKAYVAPSSQKTLDELYQVMVDFPTSLALITGHSDNIGSEYNNKLLSQKRALFISDYLISKGIAPERLISKGVGSKEPIASNATEAGREKNRRVDVLFSNLTSDMAKALRETISVLPHVARVKSPGPNSNSWHGHHRDNFKIMRTQASETALPVLEQDPLVLSTPTNVAQTPVSVSEVELPPSNDAVSQPQTYASAHSSESRPFQKAGDFIRYSLGVGGYYNSLDVRNQVGPGTADWISKINYNAELAIQWSLSSSRKTWMGLRVAGHKQDYEHPQSPSLYSWDGETPNLLRASLMFDFEGERFGLGLDLDISEEAFLQESAFLVTIEKNKVFGISTRLKYKILSESSHSARLGLDVSYAVGGVEDAVKDIIKETKAKDRLSYIGYLDFRTQDVFEEHELGVKFYYGLRSFANEYNLQEEEVVGLMFTLYSPAWL